MKRFWEIDLLRGLAIIGMIIYHLLVDLRFFYNLNIAVFSGPLLIFARLIAVTFIFLVGVSASFQRQRRPLSRFFTRSLIVLFWAAVISLTTYFLFPTEFVFFGILHLIGISLILLIPFLFVPNKLYLFISGLIVIATSIIISRFNTDSFPLIFLGFKPKTITSLDYFPLFPWFALVIFGLAFGRLYPKVRPQNLEKPRNKVVGIIEIAGQRSLAIYLLHQPVLISLLFLFRSIFNVY